MIEEDPYRRGGVWTGYASKTFTQFVEPWEAVPVVLDGSRKVALVEGPNGAWGVAIVTQWDTKADADGFQSAATTAAAKLPHSDVFRPSDTEVPVIVGSDDTMRAHLANVLGLAG